MQITLQLRGRLHDVDVAVDRPDARVADLLRVVAPGEDGAGLVVDGRWLGPDDELAAARLYDGAMVAVGGPPEGPRPVPPVTEGLVLAVVGGPQAGAAVALPQPGSVVLGREVGADLVLSDPSLSGRHASIEVDADGRVTVADLDSTNGTAVEGRLVDEPVGIAPGALIEIGATQLRVRPQGRADRPVAIDPSSGFASIPFNRPPRPAAPRGAAPMTSPDAPLDEESTKVPFSVIAIIGPLVFAGVMIAVTGSIRFALFGLLSPVMAIGNYATSKHRAKKALKSSAGKYRRAVEQLEHDLAAGAVAEGERREALLPDPAEVLRRALLPSVALWQRRPTHDDFLCLRAGAGTVPWAVPVEPPRGAGLPPEVRDLVARHAHLPRSPVPVDLRSGQAVGIVGDRAVALALARSLVAQAAVHHGPADAPMVVLAAEEAAPDWDWVKWLPHVRDASGTSRALAGDREAAEALLVALSSSAPPDRPLRVVSGIPPPAGPTRLYVIDDVTLMEGRRAKARELLRGSAGPAAGIVLAPTEDRLPAVCSTVITVAGTGDAVLRRPAEGLVLDDVVIAGLAEPTARAVARALSRFEDPELDLPGSGLPALVRLPPLLGMDEPDQAAVARAWCNGLPDPGPSTPVGIGEDGVVVLDLKTDGPHGLIGGTTGSGKSELLRSLVAGMAARVDPDHLVFVLVDYKGG
ncbi:MAG: FHA domain-containing protein, partial [Acidimicrobiia bacterium]|nr:FHA domain-containing protein [Acidimicrobiia bacterium]